MIAGALLLRGIVLALTRLSGLLPNFGAAQALESLEIALGAVLILGARWPNARRAFAVSFAATVIGLFFDALTPSYDAAAWWSWASAALELVAGLGILAGLVAIARVAGGFGGVALIALGQLAGVARWHLGAIPSAVSMAAGLLAFTGHLLMWRRVRALPASRPAAVAPGSSLFRWGLLEWARFTGTATLFVVMEAGRAPLWGPVIALLFCALTAIGLCWLARFTDATQVGAASLAWTLATGVVAAQSLVPMAEAYLADRESALARAGILALVTAFLWLAAASSLLGTVGRAADAMDRPRTARVARLLRVGLLMILVAAAAIPLARMLGGWDVRHLCDQLAVVVAYAFLVVWLGYLVLVPVAGRAFSRFRV